MAEIDGLGQVYQKQGNTGAATWESPIEQGQTPFAYMAEDLNRKNLLTQQYNLAAKKQAEKQKADELAKAYNPEINEKSWVVDRQVELGRDLKDYTDGLGTLQYKGIDPRDLSNPEARAVAKLERDFYNKDLQSKNQEQSFNQLRDLVLADSKLAPEAQKFDHQKTFEGLNAWRDSPSIADRTKVNPEQLLIPKEKIFTTYDPVSSIDPNKFRDEIINETPDYKSGKKTLNKKALRTKLEGQLLEGTEVNAANKPHYEWGLEKNLWASPKQYVDVQNDWLEKQVITDKTYEKKDPATNDSWQIDFDNLSDEEYLAKYGSGTQPTKVTKHDTKGNTIEGQFGDVTLPNVMQLGDSKMQISTQSFIDVSTGKPYSEDKDKKGNPTGVVTMDSGVLTVPFVDNKGRIMALGGAVTYKGKDNKYHTLTNGTEEQKAAILTKEGYGKFKPMVYGQGKANENTVTGYVDASSVSYGTGTKGALSDQQKAYKSAQRIAKSKNVNSNSIKYVLRTELKDKAEKAGYALDEYTKMVTKNGIIIID